MTVDTDLGQIWGDVLDEVTLSEGFSPHQRGILRLTRPVGFFSGTAVVAVPNDFTRDNIESRHIPLLCSALERRFQTKVHLTFTVDPTLAPELDDDTTDAVADGTYAQDRTVTLPETAVVIPIHPGMQGPNRTTNWNQGPTVESAGRPMPNGNRNPTHQMSGPSRTAPSGYPGSVMTIGGSSRLNPKYTFDTFVIGTSNRFAHAAAIAVSEAPAQAYNPLVIYGGSGLGKTHLLHAIGNYTLATSAGARVMYVSSEEFTNDFINSIRDSNRNERAPEFQAKYRAVDLLLVDDIQFFAGKTQTQEEFFHTFNTLHNNNKQMVFTSDTNPRDLPDFMERLRSRFEWGLITDVQPPDLETRIAILRKKTLQDRMRVPDDVLEFIADKVATNIRELEGALIRVTAYASLNQSNVDLDMAASVLKNIINDQNLPEVSAGLIMSQTAAHYGFSIEDLCGPSRSRNLVKARQVAMYLCRDMTDMSLPKIGQEFGGRDHTTVMHAVRKMTDQMAQRRTLYNQVQDLTTRIRSEARSSQRGFGR